MNKKYFWNCTRIIIITAFGIILSGCGGFSEEAISGSSSTASIFLQGKVNFPSVNSSISKIASISKSVSNSLIGSPVGQGRVFLYKASDIFFQDNLLKSGSEVLTNPDGSFAITSDQIRSGIFSSNKESLIIRVLFGDKELISLAQLKKNTTIISENLSVNLLSDSAFRYVKEEISAKIGGVVNQSSPTYSKILEEMNILLDDLSQNISSIQNDFTFLSSDFNSSDYIVGKIVSTGNSGSVFSKQLKVLAQTNQIWKDSYEISDNLKAKVFVESSLPLSSIVQTKRRKLQLFYTFLNAGFFISDGLGNFFVKDKWKSVNLGNPPSIKTYLISNDLIAFFDGTLISSDFDLLPLPNDLLRLNINELINYSIGGTASKEKVVRLARDAREYPWVSKSIIEGLSQKDTQFFVSFNTLIDNLSEFFIQKRFSIERVQKNLASEGLILFGEDHLVPAEFTSFSKLKSEIKAYWASKSFSSTNLIEFEKLMREPENYFSYFKKIFQADFGELSKTNFSITASNNGYPDALSEVATQNFIFRKISNQRVVSNNWIKSYIEVLEKNFSVLYRQKTISNKLPMDNKVSLRELISFIPLIYKQSFSLDKSKSYFKDILTPIVAKTPRLDNIKFFNLDPVKMDSLWTNLITSSSIVINFTTDTSINLLSQKLKTLETSVLADYEVPKSLNTSINVSGKIFRGLGGNKVPAGFYSIFAQNKFGIRFLSQTDAEGNFNFFNNKLSGDQSYKFGLELKHLVNGSLASSNVVTVAFDYYVLGFENELTLPDFSISEDYHKLIPQSEGKILDIQILNTAPQISFVKNITKTLQGVIPIDVNLIDGESDLIDVFFSYTLGQNLLRVPSEPKISLSSSQNAIFFTSGIAINLPSSPAGLITTIYWHSDKEILDEDTTGLGDQDDVQVTMKVVESSNKVIFGNEIKTGFLLMDNSSPELEITFPLDNGIALGLNSVTILGKSIDISGITSIWVSNTSLETLPITSIFANNTGISFNTFEIVGVPVEAGIKNKLEFFAIDTLGNINKIAKKTEFSSLDVVPPNLHLTKIEVLGVKIAPTLTSTDLSKVLSVNSTITQVDLLHENITYNINTESKTLQLDIITTNSIVLTAIATDRNLISLVKVANSVENVSSPTSIYNFQKVIILTEGNNFDLVLSASDDKNNNSGTTDPNQQIKTRSAIHLKISTIDFSPPQVAITNLELGSLEQLVTTNIVEIKGAATDLSKITTLTLCSEIKCESITSNFLDWSVNLPISEAKSNAITGFISDEHGFIKQFTNNDFFTKLNLNDITKPRATITSVNDFTLNSLPYLISTSRSLYNTEILDLNCTSLNCTGQFTGFIEDESGFLLSRPSIGTDTRTFNEFSFRFADLSIFSPQNGDSNQLLGKSLSFSTKKNYILLNFTPNINSTKISFQATIVLGDDGVWPMKLDLKDNSINLFGESNFTSKSLNQRGILYFRKDKTPPQITVSNIIQFTDNKSGKYKITGNVKDELSRIANISVNGVNITTFTAFTIDSPWKNLVSLDPLVSVQFSAELTLSSGNNQQIVIVAQDIHGNASSVTTSINVFPLFNKTISRKDLFQEPIQVGFGGTNLDKVFVADKKAKNVREFSIGGDARTTFVGNIITSSIFFSKIDRLDSFDMFYDKGKNLESILMSGKYLGRTVDDKTAEIAHFPKVENSEQNQITRPDVIGKFALSSNQIKGDKYHIFRENDISTSADTFISTSVIRYTPLLESVVYVAAQTNTGQNKYLRRYVKSFSKNVDPLTNEVFTAASEGGFSKSTGTILDFPSIVTSITLTQVHTLNNLLPGGISDSKEYIYLAMPKEKSIVRYKFINSNLEVSSAFTKIATWTFTDIKPYQIEIDRDGKFIYVSDQDSLKLYKYSITASDTLTVVGSFGEGKGFIGGLGFKDENFRSITGIRGFIPLNQDKFLTLYITDSISKRVSVYTTDGSFIKYFADNPYGLGGIEDSALLAEYKNDEWLLLDKQFDAYDVYNSVDTAYKRVSAKSLGIVSYTTQIQEILFAKEKIIENKTNLLDTNYFTNSKEEYKTTSNTLYFIESQNNELYVIKNSTSISFTAILTSVVQGENAICTSVVPSVAWTDTCTTLPEFVPNIVLNQRVVTQHSTTIQDPRSHLLARDLFGQNNYKLKAIDLIEENNHQRLMILESGGNNVSDRVQMFSEKEIHLSSTNTGQTSGIGICDMGTYLIIAGNSPSNSFSVAIYPSGSKKIQNDIFFSSYPVYDLDGVTVHSLNNAMDMQCSPDKIAIADSTGVKIFAAPSDPTQGFPMLQYIQTSDDTLASSDPLRRLSGTLDVMIRNSDLFVLEKERKRVHKYKIK